MEVDLIVIPKDGTAYDLHLGLKCHVIRIFENLFTDVNENTFIVKDKNNNYKVEYKISSKNTKMLFVKLICNLTPAKSARAIDYALKKLLSGQHRKDFNIVISYDEVSQLYCCKLMPLFGKFERRTRELVYITIIKVFGVEWYEKSFSQELKNKLLEKFKGNKTKLVEGALNELTYEQLKDYLFVPFSNQTMTDVLSKELSKDKIDTLSKDKIVSIIEECRSVSLWDRFFGEYKQFNDFRNKIENLQPKRNTVMHHKRITQSEYEQTRKDLRYVNKRLEKAIQLLEDDIYTETKLKDVVAAIGNMLSNTWGTSVTKWVDQIQTNLASLGKTLIEAAMPQINIPAILPTLNLGTELAQRFRNVYKIPNDTIQATAQLLVKQSAALDYCKSTVFKDENNVSKSDELQDKPNE